MDEMMYNLRHFNWRVETILHNGLRELDQLGEETKRKLSRKTDTEMRFWCSFLLREAVEFDDGRTIDAMNSDYNFYSNPQWTADQVRVMTARVNSQSELSQANANFLTPVKTLTADGKEAWVMINASR